MLSAEQTQQKRATLRKFESEAQALRRELNQGKIASLAEDHLSNRDYRPDALLDVLCDQLKLRNDARLAAALRLDPPVVSKLRNRCISLSPAVLLRMHDVSGLPINDLRQLAGIEPPAFK